MNTTDFNQSAASFNQEEEEEDAEDLPSCEENLFVFQLRSFPTLDRYHMAQRPQIPFVIHNTVENRVVALLRERFEIINPTMYVVRILTIKDILMILFFIFKSVWYLDNPIYKNCIQIIWT